MSAAIAFGVRAAEPEDAAGIARLSAQLGYPAAADVFAKRLAFLLPSPRHAVFVATRDADDAGDDDGLIGFVATEHRLTLEAGECVEIVGLVVAADARRSGAGGALVAAAEHWARRRGVNEIVVRSNVTRDEAHPFYAGIGYTRAKTQHAYVKSI